MNSGGAVARLPASPSIEVLREQIAPEASDAELRYFSRVCAELNLSPFADQIVFIGRYDARAKHVIHRHQITVAGRRVLATRTGRLARTDGPVWCAKRAEPNAPLVWQEVWEDDERDERGVPVNPPYCARVLVYVHGVDLPAANGTAKWSEFAQFDSNGKLIPTWRQMPSHMLGKVAESMALRRAFPEVDEAVARYEQPTYIEPDSEDRAELVEASAHNAIADEHQTSPDDARPLDVVPSDWQPTIGDQSAAHKIIAGLGGAERELFLAQWDIEDFGAVWPVGAVADALGVTTEPAP